MILLIAVLFIQISMKGQENQENQKEENIILGMVTLENLFEDAEFKREYDLHFSEYKPNEELINQIKQRLDGIPLRIVAVVGTWCSDTKEQLPVLQKILQNITPSIPIEYAAVDRNKECPERDLTEYDVELIPVFLFYFDQNLIGKIIEKPINSMEEDILEILNHL